MANCIWEGSVSTNPAVGGNWSTAAVPQAGDDVIFDGTAQDDCIGGDLTANTVASVTIAADCTIDIGTDESDALDLACNGEVNDWGTGTRYLNIESTTSWNLWGSGDVFIDGMNNDYLHIDAPSAAVTVGPVPDTPAEFEHRVTVSAGTVSIKYLTDDSGPSPTDLTVDGGTVSVYDDLDVLIVTGGAVNTYDNIDTAKIHDGTWTHEEGTLATGLFFGGKTLYNSDGAITDFELYAGGKLTFEDNIRGCTITNGSIYRGDFKDPGSMVTWGNPVQVHGSSVRDSTIDFGVHRKYTIEDIEYDAGAVVMVVRGPTDAISGDNLLDAYDRACALEPGGNALSATNRACIVIPPGRYTLAAVTGAAAMTLDTDYVDLVAMLPHSPEATLVQFDGTGDYSTVEQTCNDVRLVGFTIKNTSVAAVAASAALPQGQNGLLINCAAGDNSDSIYRWMRFLRPTTPGHIPAVHKAGCCCIANECDFAGTWEWCTGDDYAFRLDATGAQFMTATMRHCIGGDNSFFGDIGTAVAACKMKGTYEDCVAEAGSFAGCGGVGSDVHADATFYRCRGTTTCFAPGAEFAGTAYDCEAGADSFGGGAGGSLTGTLVSCRWSITTAGTNCTGASLRNCEVEQATNNVDCFILNDDNSVFVDSTILVVQGGTGIPIDDDGNARNVVCCHCRMNNAANDADGVGALVTNVINAPAPYNIIDDQMTL